MYDEQIVRIFVLLKKWIRSLRLCRYIKNYIDLEIPSAKQMFKAPDFLQLLYVLIPSYPGVLQAAGNNTMDHFTSTSMSFACRNIWFSLCYIQHLLFTRLGFRHVEETQLVSLDISSDTRILT